MTAPVLSPVRWWRDDETRYVTRGAQKVPAAAQPDPGWMLELLAPLDPDLTSTLERMLGVRGPSSLHSALAKERAVHEMARERRVAAWSASPDPLDDLMVASRPCAR